MFKSTEGLLNVHNAGNFVDENKHLASMFSSAVDLFSGLVSTIPTFLWIHPVGLELLYFVVSIFTFSPYSLPYLAPLACAQSCHTLFLWQLISTYFCCKKGALRSPIVSFVIREFPPSICYKVCFKYSVTNRVNLPSSFLML